MDVLFIITSCAFFVWIVRNIFYCVALFQENDFRFDRLFLHLRETAEGRSILFSIISFLKWVAIVLYALVIFREQFALYFHVFVFSIYTFQAILVGRDIVFQHLKIPFLTLFTKIIIASMLLSVTAIFSFPLLDKYFWLLVIDRFIPILVLLFVFLFSFPKEVVEDLVVQKAMKKIKKHKNLLVIGIVGSYGKSSTKEFLYQLLSEKFVVIRPNGKNNSLAEIAHTIVADLKKETQIILVEIDSYGRNEIARIGHIFRPNIGILTGVNDQYLALIGSKKKSSEIKYELIESIPKNGLALFNGNDQSVFALYKHTKKQKIVYKTTTDEKTIPGDKEVIAENIIVGEKALTFDAVFSAKTIHITCPLLGKHNVENLLPAIYLSSHLGISEKTIQRNVRRISPPPHVMVRIDNENKVVFVDDTYGANSTSVLAALDYMKIYHHNKIIVLEPMLNLGTNARKLHQQIGEEIAKTCTSVLVTNTNYMREIQVGIKKSGFACEVIAGSPGKLARYIKNNTAKGDVVLFEGFEARHVLDKLL